ncbi:MAG: response regulator [Candidatus Omnitrophota bacterium]
MASPEEKTILVVDDEQEIVDFLSMALEDEGFHVLTAMDGREALDLVAQRKPDLISLDLVMPKYPGARMIRELKKNKDWADIPILVVTGHARDEQGKADLEELSLLVSGSHLEKPVKPIDYVNAVRRLLGMEVCGESPAVLTSSSVKEELKRLMEQADDETLKKALDLLKVKKMP